MNKNILITIFAILVLAFSVNAALTSVTLDSPLSNSVVSGNVALSATATDATSVNFYHGSTLIGTDSTSTDTFSFIWDTTTVINGDYSLMAQATDGNITLSSSSITVTVNNAGSTSNAPDLCNAGDLRINDVDFNDELLPGEDIVLEIEVENSGNDDIEDVEIELILFDNDNNEEVSSKTSDSFDLDEDEEIVEEIVMNVPNRFDEGDDLTLYIFVYEEDHRDRHCDSDRDDVSVERDDDDVRIEDFTLSPSILSCGENFEATVKIENFGSDDQDDLKLIIKNTDLRLSETRFFDLDEYDGNDEDVTKRFNFLAQKDVKDGTYSIEARVEYDNGKLADSSFESLTLKNCVKDILDTDVSITVMSTSVTEGKAFSIPVIVRNNENRDLTYEIEVSGDWVEISTGDKVRLRPGQEITMYGRGIVKSGITGSSNGVVSVMAEGTHIQTQTFSVDVKEAKESKTLELSPIATLSIGLGIVALIIIIISIFVLYFSKPKNRKPVNKVVKNLPKPKKPGKKK